MAYRVLALDIDGTLTNSKKQITEKTKKAVSAAAAKEDSSTLIPKTGHGRSCSNRTTRSTP